MCQVFYMPAFEAFDPDMPDWSEMHAASWMSALSDESVMSGFIPSVVMCAGCGNYPAESRDESVFALCAACCEVTRWRTEVVLSGQSQFPGMPGWSEMSESDRMTAVWRDMHSKYGYAMMDAELSKMFD